LPARQLCYLIGIVLTLAAAAAVLRIEEPREGGGEWRLQTPSVPREVRGPFARAALTGAAVWAIGALFLSVVPSYAAKLLTTSDLALLGAITAVMLAMACVAQAISLRGATTPGLAQPLGLVLVVAGIVALVLAFPLHSLVLVLVAAVLAGTGLGFGYYGSQAEVNRLAPAERRGEVTAAFITCMYSGVVVTAVATGLIADASSLATAVAIAGVAVAVLASATTVWHVVARNG
jgi:MFS family permease